MTEMAVAELQGALAQRGAELYVKVQASSNTVAQASRR